MMCQCRCINFNKGTALVWEIHSGGERGQYGSSVLATQFCSKTKSALKIKISFKLIAQTSKKKSVRIRRFKEWTNQIHLINICRALYAAQQNEYSSPVHITHLPK